MKKTLFFILLSLFFLGCNANKSKESMTEVTTLSSLEEAEVKSDGKLDLTERKLIKNGDIRFQIKDVEKTNQFIKNSIKKFGAYISKDENSRYDNKVGYDIKIRVPAAKYDSLIVFILNNADIVKLDYKSTEIDDVTADFIDIQTRLKIKKASEEKLIELLKQAKNLRDVLAVQKQLTELQADIESIEGRMKYLSDQVNYSTLDVSYYKKENASNKFFEDFWGALKNGWQVFLQVLTFVANLWVIILVIIAGIWGYKSYRIHRKVKKTKKADSYIHQSSDNSEV